MMVLGGPGFYSMLVCFKVEFPKTKTMDTVGNLDTNLEFFSI